jgi:xanthomonalisin
MTMTFRQISMAVAIGASISVSALAAAPYPTRSTPAAQDIGPVTAQADAATLTVTLPLKLRNEQAAEALLKTLSAPGSAGFHQFLTPAQFKAQFGQSDADVAAAAAYLGTFGLTAPNASTPHRCTSRALRLPWSTPSR